MTALVAADEHPHAPDPTSAWSETWEWRLVLDDGSLALVVALVRRPAEARLSYVCSLFGRDRPTVTVLEHDISLPRRGSLELRASGIWADHICETPFAHWNLGLEAFGLALDDPEDALGDGRGVLTPVGLDVEWEDESPAVAITEGYLASGTAHGEVLVGFEEHDVVGAGHRLHRWGTGPRLPEWWGRGAEVGAPPLAVNPTVMARSAADDDLGGGVEWVLDSSPGAAPAPPRLLSRSRAPV